MAHEKAGKKKLTVGVDGVAGLRGLSLRLSLRDSETGELVSEYERDIYGDGTFACPVRIPRLGFFDYEVSILKDGEDVIAFESSNVSVVPRRVKGGISDFAVSTHFAQGKGRLPYSMDLISMAGFSTIRDEIYWRDVEKRPGVFDFPAKYDEYIDEAGKYGISPLVLLGYGHPMVSPYVERGFPVDDRGRAQFVNYVRNVVGRYGGRVKRWELWNEPQPSSGLDPETVYLPLLEDVYEAIKEISPDALVLASGGAPNHVDGAFVRPLLSNGGAASMDGFAMHTYVAPNTPELGYATPTCPTFKVASVPTMWTVYGEIADRYSNRGKAPEAWVTEMGWYVTPRSGQETPGGSAIFIDGLRQAAYAARLFLLSRRYGTVRSVCLYDFQNDGIDPDEKEDNFGMITMDFAPKESFSAISVLANTLTEKRFVEAVVETDETKVYRFSGDDGEIMAMWNVNKAEAPLEGRTAGTVSLRLDRHRVTVVDWQGKSTEYKSESGVFNLPLTENPSYIILK